MTATITRPPAGAEVIEEAREVFRHARAASAQWPAGERDSKVAALRVLGEALKHYSRLSCGVTPWWLDGMRPGVEGLDDTLRRAADIAWEASEEVTALIGENEEAAGAAGDGGE